MIFNYPHSKTPETPGRRDVLTVYRSRFAQGWLASRVGQSKNGP
jgi:hypothetical protein